MRTPDERRAVFSAANAEYKKVVDKGIFSKSFGRLLRKGRNATVSFRQMVRELEATQETLWSPLILNGDGFGMLANHSLVMANYVTRANAALVDLRKLLQEG